MICSSQYDKCFAFGAQGVIAGHGSSGRIDHIDTIQITTCRTAASDLTLALTLPVSGPLPATLALILTLTLTLALILTLTLALCLALWLSL